MINTVGNIGLALLMFLYIATSLSNVFVLNQHTFKIVRGETLKIVGGGNLSGLLFFGLGILFYNYSQELSQFFQNLFHIPVTGVELLIILDIIAGIVLGLWLFKLCVVLWQHSLKKELVIFLACISLLLFVGMGLTIFFILHPSNQSVVAISGIIIASILEVLLALLLRVESKSKSFQHTYSGFWIIIYFVLIQYGFF